MFFTKKRKIKKDVITVKIIGMLWDMDILHLISMEMNNIKIIEYEVLFEDRFGVDYSMKLSDYQKIKILKRDKNINDVLNDL